MIIRLNASNFLSLDGFSLTLAKRNVLVGPNMSGKSNILSALEFLTRAFATNLNQALLEQQSLGDILFLGQDNRSFLMDFSIECNGPEENETFTYALKLQGATPGAFVIESERLILNRNSELIPLVEMERGQGKVLHLNGEPVYSSPGTNHSALEFGIPGWYGTRIKDLMATWQFFNLVPLLMKQPSAIKGEKYLNKNGNNFSSWFMTLQTQYPKEYRDIKNAASSCLPGLEEILTVPTQTSTAFLATKEKGLKRNIPLWRMSDGELVFLAYLSLLYAPPELSAPVVCIEEPENFLNPKLLEQLLEIWDQRSRSLSKDATQVIITTHSPSLVNKVSLDDLIVVRKRDGKTSAVRASEIGSRFRTLLQNEDLGLGELWQSGALNAD